MLSLPPFSATSSLLWSAYFKIKHYKVLCWPQWGQRVMTPTPSVCTDDLTPGEWVLPFGSKQASCQGQQPPLAFRSSGSLNLKTRQAHTNWTTALKWTLFPLLMFLGFKCYRVFRWGVDAGVDHMSLCSHRLSQSLPSPFAPPSLELILFIFNYYCLCMR